MGRVSAGGVIEEEKHTDRENQEEEGGCRVGRREGTRDGGGAVGEMVEEEEKRGQKVSTESL